MRILLKILSIITIILSVTACGGKNKSAELAKSAPSATPPLPTEIIGCCGYAKIQLAYDSINRLNKYITRNEAGTIIDSVNISYSSDTVKVKGRLNNSNIVQYYRLNEQGCTTFATWEYQGKGDHDYIFRYDFDNFLTRYSVQDSKKEDDYIFEVVNNNISTFTSSLHNVVGTISYSNLKMSNYLPFLWESIDIPELYPALFAGILGKSSQHLPDSIHIEKSRKVTEVITFSDVNFDPDGNISSWTTTKSYPAHDKPSVTTKGSIRYTPAR